MSAALWIIGAGVVGTVAWSAAKGSRTESTAAKPSPIRSDVGAARNALLLAMRNARAKKKRAKNERVPVVAHTRSFPRVA